MSRYSCGRRTNSKPRKQYLQKPGIQGKWPGAAARAVSLIRHHVFSTQELSKGPKYLRPGKNVLAPTCEN